MGEDGRAALTFLRQIDLGELPVEVAAMAEGLEGTLLFFSNTNFDGVGDPWSAAIASGLDRDIAKASGRLWKGILGRSG